MNKICQAIRYLSWFTDSLNITEGDKLKEVIRTLRSFEYPAFTAVQVSYWLASEYHSGQGSPGYKTLSILNYRPSALETLKSLREVDVDFETLYRLLQPYAVDIM